MMSRFISVQSLILCILLFCDGSISQDVAAKSKTVPTQKAVTGQERIEAPSRDSLRSSLEEVQSDASLEEVVRDSLVKRYEQAIESATHAATSRELEQDFSEALTSGPEEVKRLGAELEKAKETSADPPPETSRTKEEIVERLTETQRERAVLVAELSEAEGEVAELEGRPEAIPDELSAAKDQLKKVRADIDATAPGDDASTKATLALLKSQYTALEAKIAMLEKEELSADIRTTQASLTRDLLREQVSALDRRIESLQSKAVVRISEDVRKAVELVEKYPGEKTAVVLSKLIDELREVAELFEEARQNGEDRSKLLDEIESSYNTISAQFEKGVDSKSLSPLLLENLKKLPHPWESTLQLRYLENRISSARSGLFQVQRDLEPGPDTESETDQQAQPESATELESMVVRIREDLTTGYENLIRELDTTETTERILREVGEEFREYAEAKLFSVRSSSALLPGGIVHLPDTIKPVFGGQRIAELWGMIKKVSAVLWICGFVLLALFFGLYLLLAKWLNRLGTRARHLSTEAYRQTLFALILTALLAALIPAVIGIVGIAIAIQPHDQEWMRTFGTSLFLSIIVVFPISFLFEVCREKGLADVHFRWDRKILERLRKFCLLFAPVAFVSVTAISISNFSFDSDSTVSPMGELKRIPLLLLVVVGGILLARLLHPKQGISAIVYRASPSSLFGKWRHLWYWTVIVVGVTQVVLLLIGFVYTAGQLSELIARSLWSVAIAFVIYGMFYRWLVIREHKQIRKRREEERAERLERRKAELEKEGKGENITEIVSDEDAEMEEEVDSVSVREQTRRFLAFFAGLWLFWKLHWIWGQFGPLSSTIGTLEVGSFSFGEILYTVVVIAILVSTIRNLPGILEVLVFQRTGMDEGTKTAVISLANYFVIAIAGIVIFRNLGVDWSQFGWIAAALSVGLGFGLQEVVANFVSGIILLFERPIRVGDVVTVDGVDGKVSRIQIRATTILDWDRKELIVPNKRFITGTLKNWTRSNSINRVIVPVGVAYGTDTEKARDILLEIARSHGEILEDPGPVATFEEFGDSSLNLILRAYLPNLDNRLGVITDLHTMIDKKFGEAGIEIAFPQLDVHVSGADSKEEGES